MVFEIANVWAIILMNQYDDDSDREISNHKCEQPAESTFSSVIEEDDLDIWQEVQHLDQIHCDKTIRTTWVLLPMGRSRADTVIARTPLPNLQHPVAAIALTLLKREKSAINISCESDIVQVLPLPNTSGDHNVPQPKAGGDHNVPQHHKATIEIAKRFMEAIVFTKTPWPIISNEDYSIVDEAWKRAIETQDHQRALAGAPIGTPSVCQLPSSPSLKIDPPARVVVNVYSVFCSSIGLMMILNPQKFIVKAKD
jgi:hypothetical protein